MGFTSKIIFVYIFILGVAFAFLVPPLQKPDEHVPFKRALYLRQGYVFLWGDSQKLPIEKQFNDLLINKKINNIPYEPSVKMDTKLYDIPVFSSGSDNQIVYLKEPQIFMRGAFAFIPHAMGLFVARIFNLNAYISFFMGRGGMFIVSFVWMLVLYKKTKSPFNHMLLFAFTLPMTIHQITGYGYDGMNYMTGFTLFSVFVHLYTSKKITNKDLFVFGLILFLFMISKVIYEAMILLVFLLPRKKISANVYGYIKKMALFIIVLLICYFLVKSPIYLSSISYNQNPPGVMPGKQLEFIVKNPVQYLIIFTQSSIGLSKFHFQGLIGIFGWLDYSMSPWIYGVYVIAALLLMFTVKLKKKGVVSKKAVLGVLFILFIEYSYILTFFYMYWKPVASPIIDGTQGRYFIMFIPFIIYILTSSLNKYKIRFNMNNTIVQIAFTILLCLMLVSIVNNIQVRYY